MVAPDMHDAISRSPVSNLAREVIIHGPILRSELAERLGMSLATITRLTKPLLDARLLIEIDDDRPNLKGRPAKPLDVNVDAHSFLGFKITGDEAAAASTDLRTGALAHGSHPLIDHSLDTVVDAIELLAKKLTGSRVISAIGICLGGRVTGGRVVDRAPYLGWEQVDLAGAVEDRLGIPTHVENDVTALTAAEHWFGLGKGLPNLAVVTVGAGVGYGLVMHDQVVNTASTGLGLGGHVPLNDNGPACFLGHPGCSTAMLSIPSITAQVSESLHRVVGYDEVLALAAAGEPEASRVMSAAGRALGRMIAAVANLAMVEHVVLSGEGLGMLDVCRAEVDAALLADRDPDAAPVNVLVDDSGYIRWAQGAASIAIQATLDGLATTA